MALLTSADIRRMMRDDIDRLKAASDKWYREKPDLHGYPTGLQRLDTLVGGMVPDELIIIGGDPGSGKTSLMMQGIEYSARYFQREGIAKVNLVISAEMPRKLLYTRSACRIVGIDSTDLRRGRVSEAEKRKFDETLDALYALPILVLDTPGITSENVLQAVDTLIDDEGLELGVVGIDYIQQLYDEGPDLQRINAIMRNIVKVKMTTGASVVALSQYSLPPKGQEKRVPQLGNFLGSGNIGRAADQAWMLHDPEVEETFQGPGPKALRKDIYVRKNRNGKTGMVSLWYAPSHTKFFSPPSTAPKTVSLAPPTETNVTSFPVASGE